MIFRNKIRAIASIPLGLLVSACAGILKISKPEFADIADIAIFVGYGIYLWGCFDLIVGKGYSKWLMLLVIIPVIPGLIILLLLRDRNREPRTAAERKSTRVAIALTGTICLWIGSIFVLRAFMDIFVEPILSQLEHPVRELRLPAVPGDAGELYLMGLRMRFPVQGPSTGSVVPHFDSRRLQGMTIFLNDGNTAAGALLLDRYPDDLGLEWSAYTPLYGTLYNVLFFDNSSFGFVDAMYRAQHGDFSWWNPIRDIRLAYILLEKAMALPVWHEGGALYRLQTGCLSGYLARGKYRNGKYLTQLVFKNGGHFYDIMIIDRRDRDYGEMLSSICVANETEADRIIEGYAARGVARDVELASRMSRKVTHAYLNEMIGLIEQRRAAGEKTVRDTDALKAELTYLNGGPPRQETTGR